MDLEWWEDKHKRKRIYVSVCVCVVPEEGVNWGCVSRGRPEPPGQSVQDAPSPAFLLLQSPLASLLLAWQPPLAGAEGGPGSGPWAKPGRAMWGKLGSGSRPRLPEPRWKEGDLCPYRENPALGM